MPSPHTCQGQEKEKHEMEQEVEPDESWENITMAPFCAFCQLASHCLNDSESWSAHCHLSCVTAFLLPTGTVGFHPNTVANSLKGMQQFTITQQRCSVSSRQNTYKCRLSYVDSQNSQQASLVSWPLCALLTASYVLFQFLA